MAMLAHLSRSARAPSAAAEGLAHNPVPSVPQPESDPGRPLDADVQREMTSLLGHDFAHVRVHDDATATVAARRLNAAAYTVGHHVVLGAAGRRPDSAVVRALLAH